MRVKLLRKVNTNSETGVQSVVAINKNTMATCSALCPSIKLWRIANGKLIKKIHLNKNLCLLHAIKLSKTFALACEYSGKMHLIDPLCRDRKIIKSFRVHGGEIIMIRQLSKSFLVASGDIFGIVKLWLLHSGESIFSLQEKEFSTYAFDLAKSFEAKATWIFVAGLNKKKGSNEENCLNVWEISKGNEVPEVLMNIPKPHMKEISFVFISYETSLVFSCGGDYFRSEVKAWSLFSGNLIWKFAENSTKIIYMGKILLPATTTLFSYSQGETLPKKKIIDEKNSIRNEKKHSIVNTQPPLLNKEIKGKKQNNIIAPKNTLLTEKASIQKKVTSKPVEKKNEKINPETPSSGKASLFSLTQVENPPDKITASPLTQQTSIFNHSDNQLIFIYTITFDRNLTVWSLKNKEKNIVCNISIPLQYHSLPYGGFDLQNKYDHSLLYLSCSNTGNTDILIYRFQE